MTHHIGRRSWVGCRGPRLPFARCNQRWRLKPASKWPRPWGGRPSSRLRLSPRATVVLDGGDGGGVRRVYHRGEAGGIFPRPHTHTLLQHTKKSIYEN